MSAGIAPRIWTLTDDRAGNFLQADALARALGTLEHHVRLRFPPPWRWTSPRGVPGALARLPLPEDAARPDIAVGCGRQSALALRALRRAGGGRVYTVQILDPRIDPAEFDLVVAPRHDALQGANVLCPIGAMNAIDTDWLAAARATMPALADGARPLNVVMIGGPHRDAALDVEALRQLGTRLHELRAREGGSFLLCGSRRTPAHWQSVLRDIGQSLDARCWFDARDGASPYRAGLGHADRIVVTADSVNMLSEACAVGVRVLSFAAGPLAGKLGEFDRTLREQGLLSSFDAAPAAQAPLRETAAIAEEILRRWRAQPAG